MSTTTIGNNQIVREMLLTSVSCGDPDLLKLLEDNIDTILLINQSCHEEIYYLKAQLSMIDMAMVFTRNKVDESRTRAQSKGFDQYRSKFENEAKAQRTSQSRTCAFADATSFQQFDRDSVNRMRSESDMESNAEGSTQTTQWDRSIQSASGYSVIADYASSSSDGEGDGSSVDVQINSGKSYSKSSREFGPDTNDRQVGNYIPDLPSPQEVLDTIGGALKWVWDLAGDAVTEAWHSDGVQELETGSINQFNTPLFNDQINDSYNHQFVETSVQSAHPWLGCCCNTDGNPDTNCPPDPTLGENDQSFICEYDYINPFPSYGRGYNAKYNLSFGVPTIGVMRVDWGVGEQFRQSHTMTQGCTRGTGEGSTRNIYEQTDFSESKGDTDTRDESQTTRDVHRIGDSERDSRSDTTAGAASTGDAHSESHTGSDRTSHSERRAANQGTAWSKGRGRGDGLTTSDNKTTTEVRHWSQIFKNLIEMYNRIFEQIMSYDKIRSLSIGIAVEKIDDNCQYSLPNDPIVAARLRRRVGHVLTRVCQ